MSALTYQSNATATVSLFILWRTRSLGTDSAYVKFVRYNASVSDCRKFELGVLQIKVKKLKKEKKLSP
jgi:hypothetical protein